MTKALFFHTDRQAQMRNVSIMDGRIKIGAKTFDADLADHLDLKTSLGTEPLYFLKWDCIQPAKIRHREYIDIIKSNITGKPIIEEKTVNHIITFTRDAQNTPESLYKTETLKILGGMLKVKGGGTKGGLPVLIVGTIVGMVVSFMLFYLKILRI